MMSDFKILNEGRKDVLNPLNEEEMNYLMGGLDSSSSNAVSCKRAILQWSASAATKDLLSFRGHLVINPKPQQQIRK